MRLLSAALAASLFALGASAQTIPSELLPKRIAGSGITVADLDRQMAFYTGVLGMKLVRTYQKDGAVYEYILTIPSDKSDGAILALLKGTREPGATTYGRLILVVPDADKLAAALSAQGIPARKVAEGAYFFKDPEGNAVEAYPPPEIVKP